MEILRNQFQYLFRIATDVSPKCLIVEGLKLGDDAVNHSRREDTMLLKDLTLTIEAIGRSHAGVLFADLESGKIDTETFREGLSRIVGQELSMEDCYEAVHAYVGRVQKRGLKRILELRKKGYKGNRLITVLTPREAELQDIPPAGLNFLKIGLVPNVPTERE